MVRLECFNEYVESKLSREEIAEIDEYAQRETRFINLFHRSITSAIEEHLQKHNISGRELARRLEVSPYLIAKLRRGQINVRLHTLIEIFALLGKEPKDVFTL